MYPRLSVFSEITVQLVYKPDVGDTTRSLPSFLSTMHIVANIVTVSVNGRYFSSFFVIITIYAYLRTLTVDTLYS